MNEIVDLDGLKIIFTCHIFLIYLIRKKKI
jgi:hypothetical protein